MTRLAKRCMGRQWTPFANCLVHKSARNGTNRPVLYARPQRAPNRPIFQQKLSQKHIMRAVSKDMTGEEDLVWTPSSAEAEIFILTVLKSRSIRLLTQYVQSQRTKRLQDPLVRLVLGAKNDPVNPSYAFLPVVSASRRHLAYLRNCCHESKSWSSCSVPSFQIYFFPNAICFDGYDPQLQQ